MPDSSDTQEIHSLEVSLWVGKAGISPVIDELDAQLADRDMVKVKVLRSARGERSTAEIADELAAGVNGTVVDVRGHTAVISR